MELSVINTITVPVGMETVAEEVRQEYIEYFKTQPGYVSSTFYREAHRSENGSIRYINIVVWASNKHFEAVVNQGFSNVSGENKDGMKVLGKGFPPPITVSPGQYQVISQC